MFGQGYVIIPIWDHVENMKQSLKLVQKYSKKSEKILKILFGSNIYK